VLLYLVRHGQSESQLAGDDIPDGSLTPLGLAQAEAAADYLAGQSIDLLISSPFRRALQTADALRRRTGTPVEVWRNLSELRGVQYPLHRFMSRTAVGEVCPGASCEDDYPDDGFDHGLESREAIHERSLAVQGRLRSRFGGTELKVAVFAHWVFNSIFLTDLIGRPFGPGFAFELANASVCRVRITEDQVRLLSANEICHLPEVTY
jgi:broad specificity phosphatase PhoE